VIGQVAHDLIDAIGDIDGELGLVWHVPRFH
jgi:hypothetical protein